MAVLISIVIPTYRRTNLISALLQKLHENIIGTRCAAEIEVVVVDNCPDGTAFDAVTAANGNVKYIHEPRTGVANARNRGVQEAQGSYILFIDDDEVPDVGWIDAFTKQADEGIDACFGPILPLFETSSAIEVSPVLYRMFSREIHANTGDDISRSRPYLGAGNSMFRKSSCLSGPEPFDTRFNGGGEDVWLLRQLVEERNIRLTWCSEALVYEIVPEDRMTAKFINRRKYSDGQLRCQIEAGTGGLKGFSKVCKWMAVGALQTLIYGVTTLCLYPFNKKLATASRYRMTGGLGKMLWWQR